MKKKIIGCMMAALMFCFAGCKKEHIHSWDDGHLDNGIMTYTCSKCHETKTENKVTLYKETCNEIVETMKNLGEGTEVAALSNKFVLLSNEDVYIEAEEYDYIQVLAVAVFVDMLAEFMSNPDFRITEHPVKFTYSYRQIEQGTAVLMYEFDEKNNEVTMYWDIVSVQGSRTKNIFLYIGVDYNFETRTVESFEIYTDQESGGQSNLISWVYENEILKKLNPSADLSGVQTISDNYAAVLEAKESEIIDLEADFSEEYTTAMDRING